MKWTGGGLLAALAALAVVATILLRRAEPLARAVIVQILEDHFHARVELDSFHISLVDGLQAEGKGLRIWPPAQETGGAAPGSSASASAPGQQPLIRLDSFRFHAPLRFPANGKLHISRLQLQGLTIRIPAHAYHAGGTAPETNVSSSGKLSVQVEIDTVLCSDVLLVHETDKPGKLPLQIPISSLKLTHVSLNGPMDFEADLTNPRPNGPIHTTGSFGPWVVDDPGMSPVAGSYRFDHADLSVFKGISGSLTSTGSYQGTLNSIAVVGETDTPNFSLTRSGNPLPLHTTFHALVNGTDGDTWLDPVDATLVHSHFTAQGEIVRVLANDPGSPPHSIGHDINLKVKVDNGRIEDFLALISSSQKPMLTGVVATQAILHIPPGSQPIHERMSLNGHFTLGQALFTSPNIQHRIEELSLRGQGKTKDLKSDPSEDIESAMEGNFQMAGGVITLPDLRYTVPGAEIDLNGAYGVDGGALNFTGVAKLEATVSKIAGGWKGELLKPLNRFFEKDGAGTEVPIHIDGTRDNPVFGIDFGRIGKNSSMKP